MSIKHYLTRENGNTKINGFEDLVGELVKIRIHENGISFEKWTQEDLSQCIRFDTATLNKPVVVEFLKKHGVFSTHFMQCNNIYLQVIDSN